VHDRGPVVAGALLKQRGPDRANARRIELLIDASTATDQLRPRRRLYRTWQTDDHRPAPARLASKWQHEM